MFSMKLPPKWRLPCRKLTRKGSWEPQPWNGEKGKEAGLGRDSWAVITSQNDPMENYKAGMVLQNCSAL